MTAGIVCDNYKEKTFIDTFQSAGFTIYKCSLPSTLQAKDCVGLKVNYFNNNELEEIKKLVQEVED